MKVKYPYDILIFGLISSWLLGFLFSFYWALVTRNPENLLWYLVAAVVLVLLRKNELDKYAGQAVLIWVEPTFLVLNWVTIGVGVIGFLLTFSPPWITKEIGYFCLLLGLPSAVAILLWKRYKSINSKRSRVN